MTAAPLFLVHPGSCLGSATMNLGRAEADCLRDALIFDLERRLPVPLAVLHGALSDELPGTRLGAAIERYIRRCRAGGQPVFETMADDGEAYNQVAATPDAIGYLRLAGGSHVQVTGAWIDSSDPAIGCVTSVVRALRTLGFRTEVLDTAFDIEPACEPACAPACAGAFPSL